VEAAAQAMGLKIRVLDASTRDEIDAAYGRTPMWVGALPSAPSVDEPENNQQQDGADCSGNDRRNDPSAEVDAQSGQQPIPDKGPDDPDAEVGNETEASTAYNFASQPSRDDADQQNNEKAFT
jgi:hypothetical protein